MLVIDASVAIALLLGPSAERAWAAAQVSAGGLYAPDLLPYEVTNVLRRAVLAKKVTEARAGAALADFQSMPLALVPFAGVADRVWALRHNVSSYDAAYVAVADQLAAPLATLDRNLARSAGPRCAFRVP